MPKRLLLRAILPASFAVPWLPLPWALAALVALALLWLWLIRPPRRELFVAGLTLAGLAAVLVFRGPAEFGLAESPDEWRERVAAGYGRLWARLELEAAKAQAAQGAPPKSEDEEKAAFDRLQRQAEAWRAKRGRRSLLLIDPDGNARAWAGDGLLHELKADEVPLKGRTFLASFSAVTFFAVQPLDASPHPWRLVSGASFPTSIWPFGGTPPGSWSVAEPAAGPSVAAGRAEVWRIPLARSPTLLVEPRPRGRDASDSRRRLLWAALAAGMLSLAGMRALGLAFPGDPRPAGPHEERAWVALVAAAGVLAAGLAAGLAPPFLAALLAGLGGLLLALQGARTAAPGRGGGLAAAAAGAAGVALVFAGARAIEQRWGLLDLGGGLLVPAPELVLRLSSAAACLGVLAWAGRRRGPGPGRLWAVLAVGGWLAALVWAEHPSWAMPLLLAGGVAAALLAAGWRAEPAARWTALLLLAALGSTAIWEVAYQEELAHRAGGEILNRLTPPAATAMAGVREEIVWRFANLDLARLVPRPLGGLARGDLAYTLWRDSPLASRRALSALVVEPLEGDASSFSFGLPFIAGDRQPDLGSSRWQDLALAAWDVEQVRIYGEAPLFRAGQPWGRARFWLYPRPGFDPRIRQPLESIELGLLRGRAAEPVTELGPVLYGVYTPEGRAAISPWEGVPLAAELTRPDPPAEVRTPAGRTRAWVRPLADGRGWLVVYLPVGSALGALERATNAIVGLALALAALVPLALLLALPRTAFRKLLRRTVRSYSKRLLLIYTLLLLVPLLLLNFVLVRAVGRRLEDQQRQAGEIALTSVQKILRDPLGGSTAGFVFEPNRLAERLAAASDLVQREVTVYWTGSRMKFAASTEAPFTAGLLPQRIPGEVYRSLALAKEERKARINHVGEVAYLELYAPLLGEPRFFLSVQLLAQQEEAARQLAQLRRQGLLITILLFGLAAAVGSRLARNFTRPITELVLGTHRIAAGAPSLGLPPPNELELAALAEAVDDMAAKIADGRERLVQEKHVVERMVDNITSGVVSLDAGRRVLMHNRVAAELLGVAVGEGLEEAVAADPRLAPVAAFLAGGSAERRRETVKLAAPTGGEQEWTLVWVPLPSVGEPDALLVVEDATEELRGQRLLAWAEMARIIAHEIKNPLTPIRLSAEHMREVYRHDPEGFGPVFERCTQNVLRQVEELRSIASDFSTYSALLRIDPQPGDLVAAMAELAEGYRAAPPAGVTIDFAGRGPMPARFDAKLLARAVRNLIENALRASAGGGRVEVRVEAQDGVGRIAVSDQGPGVRPETLPRIFDPYFSTHDTGTGLGLPIARRIVEEHGGTIGAHNRPEGGLEVVITLPLAPGEAAGATQEASPP